MYKHKSIGQAFSFVTVLCILATEFIPATVAGEDTTAALNITVGEPTKLSDLVNQNAASVAVSRTGIIAAFYPKPGTNPKFYRISKDSGRTWGREMDFPPEYAGMMSVGLREGGVLFMLGTSPVTGGRPDQLQAKRIVFSDDFLKYEVGISEVSIPNIVAHTKWVKHGWPGFGVGKIVQLDNGDLLGTLYGNLKGDNNWYRTMILLSTDGGDAWRYHGSVAFGQHDPDPDLLGAYCGYCEPSMVLLSNGQLLCTMRTQGSHYPGEYRPLYQSWSDDLGKTWTKPIPTKPHLMNIAPVLAVLDNGVVACMYGRPGFHVAFSLDNGHTWQDRISFSDLPCGVITGQFDIVKVGPNRLVTIGSDADGTKVWPIIVERVKVSPAHVALEGRVLNQQGNPIANAMVERSPNRYALESWLEDRTKSYPWKDGVPTLGYRSIRNVNGHPTVQTDTQGRFRFESVKLGEYVLTVEAKGYAPQHRHTKVGPDVETEDFRLKAGRKVRSRVVDSTGRPVPSACVVLNNWHLHTDSKGFFHWSVKAPLPKQVQVNAYHLYHGHHGRLEKTLSIPQVESRPIILPGNS